MRYDSSTYRLTDYGSFGTRAMVVGGAGIVLSIIGYFVNSGQFFYSYLTAFMFWLTICLGAFFFVMLHHLINATWSIVFRRMAEALMAALPVLGLFLLPVLLGMHDIFHWSDPQVVAASEALQKKTGYLNPTFFVIRAVGYFFIWGVLIKSLFSLSVKQDVSPDENLIAKLKRISAIGVILYALTQTFASFDWLMSLDADWYSTIFGVYVYSGSYLAVLAFFGWFSLYLNKKNVLQGVITVEHYHDISRMLFAFIIFWSYIAFSQYFLIWYANIPEETEWFLHRWDGSWKVISLVLLFGHFIIPFLALMLRSMKRNLSLMKFMGIWLMVMHWFDIYWLVMPAFHEHGFHFSWMDLTTTAGIGGIVLWIFWRTFISHALVPVNDPRLEASINLKH